MIVYEIACGGARFLTDARPRFDAGGSMSLDVLVVADDPFYYGQSLRTGEITGVPRRTLDVNPRHVAYVLEHETDDAPFVAEGDDDEDAALGKDCCGSCYDDGCPCSSRDRRPGWLCRLFCPSR